MKKFVLLILTLILTLSFNVSIFAGYNEDDVRAVWVSTIYNLDYPSQKDNPSAQKAEFTQMLDKIQALGLNTVVVQVRPKSDALYKSNINPWSEVLTGTQGKDPGYDPLAFMIEETHKRGMSFHAWLNPYRITTSGTDINALAANHPARLNPNWVLTYNNALYYNPDLDQVKQYIADTVKEIVVNNDVDAIHFDDYFYPTRYPLPEGESADGTVANARRNHIDKMVQMVSSTIKSAKPNVKFGISPMGIWKNDQTGNWGSKINGSEGYYAVFADAKSWIQNGWIDYITPQIYWENGNKAADYTTLVKWWADAVKGTNVKLYIGEGIYKDIVSTEITSHLTQNENLRSGTFFYSLKDILNNRQGVADSIKAYYSGKTNGGTTLPDKPTETKPAVPAPSVPVKTVDALYNKATVKINNKVVEFEAYNIDGYNYFKLRDIAMALTDTGNAFDVEWDRGEQAINLVVGKPYTVAGGELIKGNGKNKKGTTSIAKLIRDNEDVSTESYTIDDMNYFKLRDLGDILSFGVVWDEETNTISILTLN